MKNDQLKTLLGRKGTAERYYQDGIRSKPFEGKSQNAIFTPKGPVGICPVHSNNYTYLYYKDKNNERSPAFIKYWNDYSIWGHKKKRSLFFNDRFCVFKEIKVVLETVI